MTTYIVSYGGIRSNYCTSHTKRICVYIYIYIHIYICACLCVCVYTVCAIGAIFGGNIRWRIGFKCWYQMHVSNLIP